MHVKRLRVGDRDTARTLFTLMADVFTEESEVLSDAYIDALLNRNDFWAIAAFTGDELIGGLTAHTLPMTRTASSEIFIYDIAVHRSYQRIGVGRRLMAELRDQAAKLGIHEVFVPADTDDIHALDFYRALGGTAAPVIIFSFTQPGT